MQYYPKQIPVAISIPVKSVLPRHKETALVVFITITLDKIFLKVPITYTIIPRKCTIFLLRSNSCNWRGARVNSWKIRRTLRLFRLDIGSRKHT